MKKNSPFVNLFLEKQPDLPQKGLPSGIWRRMELLFIKRLQR